MNKKYMVGFLIPEDSKRFLGDSGWEFESDSRLPKGVELLLASELFLCEESQDYSSYEGPNLKVDVFKDEFGNIENIYFRFYGGGKPKLPAFILDSKFVDGLEFFVPE